MNDTRARLREIDQLLTTKARALAYAEQIAGRQARVGDAGWLLSPAAAVPGTLLAVIGGQRARKWAGHASRLRHEITELRVERRLLERLPG